MPEPMIQDPIREAAEKQQREMVEKIIENQIKIITASYDKATAYTNLIVVAGYAAFFGLWTLTKAYLTKPLAMWAALLMLSSAATFVFFEVYKMFFTSRSLVSKYIGLSDRIKGKPLGQVLTELQKIDSEAKAEALRFLPAWRVSLLVAVITGLGGVGLLLYAFAHALLSGAA
jgi:hypothetical protein